MEDQNPESSLIEGDNFDDSFKDVQPWQVSECLNEPCEKMCVPVSLQAIYKNASACKNAQALCLCRQTVSSPVILCGPLLRSYRFWKETVKQHLFPNCRLSFSCFWLGDRNPSIPLPLSALFFFQPFLLLSFVMAAAEPFPAENYSESLSTAPSQSVPPSLCLLLRGPFPSSSPSGAARKERSVMALWRENGGIHPMLWRW